MAEQYIELYDGTAHMHADDMDLISRHLSIRPGAVLDVGCGPGHLTAYLCSLGVDATGIDLVPEFIDHARAAHPDGQFKLGSVRSLPVPDGSVAGILAWYSLIHVRPDDLDEVLCELRRAIAPTGKLVIGLFDGDEVVAFEHKVVPAYLWPVEEFAERLRRAGFAVVEGGQRPGIDQSGQRPHASFAALAS